MEYFKTTLLIASLVILTACGGSSSGATDNNNAANATPMDINTTVIGQLDVDGDDVDVYKVTTPVPGYLIIELRGPESEDVDFDLGLYIDDVHSIAIKGGDTSTENINEYLSEEGVYYVAVNAFEGSGSYELEVKFGVPASQVE